MDVEHILGTTVSYQHNHHKSILSSYAGEICFQILQTLNTTDILLIYNYEYF